MYLNGPTHSSLTRTFDFLMVWKCTHKAIPLFSFSVVFYEVHAKSSTLLNEQTSIWVIFPAIGNVRVLSKFKRAQVTMGCWLRVACAFWIYAQFDLSYFQIEWLCGDSVGHRRASMLGARWKDRLLTALTWASLSSAEAKSLCVALALGTVLVGAAVAVVLLWRFCKFWAGCCHCVHGYDCDPAPQAEGVTWGLQIRFFSFWARLPFHPSTHESVLCFQ